MRALAPAICLLLVSLALAATTTLAQALPPTGADGQQSGSQAQVGSTGSFVPAARPSGSPTAQQLTERQQILERVNRSPLRPPQPDAPVPPPPGGSSPAPRLPTRMPTASTCQIASVFADLVASMPEQVGDCLDAIRTDPLSGVASQATSGGVLMLDADNSIAFTDGEQTWVLGPAEDAAEQTGQVAAVNHTETQMP